VTPHYCIRELRAISPLPVLSIFEPLLREITRRGIRRISVFGSGPVIKAGLYGELGKVEVVPHRAEALRYLRETYQALLDTGIGTAEQHAGLTALAHVIIERHQVDAIVLAGTDLALVFNEANINFPYLDFAALHLQTIKEKLFGEAIPPA
jgi:aspartate racemase